ncbi:MAG: hypothetical protein L0I79_06270 [Atopostipes sp.]|nr:hypothetical protein [Atopostipes sp.]
MSSLAYPWVGTNIYPWKVNHTVMDGKRSYFSGTSFALFAQWVKWWFLIIITFGIYSFGIHIKAFK